MKLFLGGISMQYTNFRTFNSAVNFYHSTSKLKLTGPIRDQLNRAALSIALNLAEGRGRATRKDQIRFFNISLSSARECQAILLIAGLEGTQYWDLLDITAAQIYKLMKSAG
jgi:four helix bundle protein